MLCRGPEGNENQERKTIRIDYGENYFRVGQVGLAYSEDYSRAGQVGLETEKN